ncbi:hypothetical protein Tco_0644627 [Tanacetum coccineum]
MSQPANDESHNISVLMKNPKHEEHQDTGDAPKPQSSGDSSKNAISKYQTPKSKKEENAQLLKRKGRLEYLADGHPRRHMRRFLGMDDAKEIWEAIRTRFGGNANSKKMQKALEAHGAEVSNEDANHKFLRSLPPSWSNLAMTMRTKPKVDTLSIDYLYNNLRVFEQEIQGASKTSSSALNVLFVSTKLSIIIRLSLVLLVPTVLKYDIWAMEMEHYLEYIDNDVWKVIQNGYSKKRISTGKDGVVKILSPVSPVEIHAVEKERKARTILLMAIPKGTF